MANNQVTVVVRIKAKAGIEARVRQELLNLLAPTRGERGCINFDMQQAPNDASLFLFHENWVSEEDLKRHFETPHITRWIQEAKALLAEPMERTRWRKVA
jgi:quinol monooxygenase YgiN